MLGENEPTRNEAALPRLDGTVARWNARANIAYLEAVDLIGAVQEDFEGLAAQVAKRREMVPVLAVDGANIATQGGDAVDIAVARLAGLEDALAGFHIELQTLHAQVRRAVGAAERLAEDTKRILNADGGVTLGGGAHYLDPPHTVPVKTAREAQLASLSETLRAELLRVKAELSDARAKLAAQASAPQVAQSEIARLRTRILELMAQQSTTASTRKLQDLSVQYEQILAQAQDTEGRRRRMGEILVSAGVLTDDQLEAALREQQTSWNRHLGTVLVELGFVSEAIVAQTLAAQIGVPYVRLIHDRPKPDALALLSRALAHHHSCVPLRFERDVLVVAMANPLDLVAIDDIELATRRSIKPVVAAASEIKAILKESYR